MPLTMITLAGHLCADGQHLTLRQHYNTAGAHAYDVTLSETVLPSATFHTLDMARSRWLAEIRQRSPQEVPHA